MKKLRHLLILLLMLILPLQGLAAAYAPLHKLLGAQAATMPCHEQHQPSHAQHANQPAADGDSTGAAHDTDSAAGHLCCQQVFTGATTNAFSSAAQKFSDVSPFVLPLYTLFIPDSPDRPPRG